MHKLKKLLFLIPLFNLSLGLVTVSFSAHASTWLSGCLSLFSIPTISQDSSSTNLQDPVPLSSWSQIQYWQLLEERRLGQALNLYKQIHRELKEGKIVTIKRNGNGGTTMSYIVKFSSGLGALFKPDNSDVPSAPGDYSNQLSNSINEVFAYEVSEQLGLHVVPITIQREILGKLGSLQVIVPQDGSKAAPAELAKILVLDFLIDNHDRHVHSRHNLLTWRGRAIGIDHSLSLHAIYAVDNDNLPPLLDDIAVNLLPKSFHTQLKLLSEDKLRARLGPMYPQDVIDDLLARRSLLLKRLSSLPFGI